MSLTLAAHQRAACGFFFCLPSYVVVVERCADVSVSVFVIASRAAAFASSTTQGTVFVSAKGRDKANGRVSVGPPHARLCRLQPGATGIRPTVACQAPVPE